MPYADAQIPSKHVAVTPSDTVNQGLIALRCGAAGTVTIKDSAGTSIQYTVTAGERIDLQITYVMATGTSLGVADLIGFRT